jgi:O-acetyl-ADP-ribose deacetylase (regulator of RNase III)
MSITYKVGDLLNSNEPVLVHGCNCKGAFGAGVAGQINKKFPYVGDSYRAASPHILGSIQPVYDMVSDVMVINLMTQLNPGRDARPNAITIAFANLAEFMASSPSLGSRVAAPRVGCGIGGLQWDEVEFAIKRGLNLSSNPDLDVVIYDLP